MNCILTLAASCVLLSGEAQNYSPRLAQSDCLVDCNSKLSACSFDCGWGIGSRSDVCRTRCNESYNACVAQCPRR